MIGIKPLSVYGLIHLLRRDKPALSDGLSLSIEEQAHIISLLRQHLLDIPDFDTRNEKSRKSQDDHDQENQERLLSERDEEI